jgi:hypothetical protein
MIDIAMDAYINKLTVLELVTRLENWATTNLIGGRSQVYPERDELVAALRKAVVREASVQVFHIKTKETARSKYGVWNECEVNDVKQDRVSALRHLPDGDYALVPIPKEVQT